MKMKMMRKRKRDAPALATAPLHRDGLRSVPRTLFFTLLLFAFLGAPMAHAEKKRKDEPKLPIPPPQPVAQELTVPRGETLEIRLTIHGRKYENLKYLIR